MKSTPGPWEAVPNDHYIDICCSSEKGSQEIHRYSPSIANCTNNTNFDHTIGCAKGNATLMAAAPELLESLEELVDLFGQEDSDPMIQSAISIINKARGEDD